MNSILNLFLCHASHCVKQQPPKPSMCYQELCKARCTPLPFARMRTMEESLARHASFFPHKHMGMGVLKDTGVLGRKDAATV